MSLTVMTALIGGVVFSGALAVLYLTPLRTSRLWTVTVTPLASIIGSGFLVAAPLMVAEYQFLAVPAMLLISGFAMLIGYVIRYNIQHEHVLHPADGLPGDLTLRRIERLSNLTISVAYVISVAFYIRLLSAFALRALGSDDELLIQLASTGILGFIAYTGYRRGLHGLEALEKVAVNIKMAVIVALLVVLLVFLGVLVRTEPDIYAGIGLPELDLNSLRTLAGLLLIVQGFETTKFLGKSYDGPTRMRALWWAQAIAALVYVLFVALAGPLTKDVADIHSETAIIEVVSVAALGSGLVLSGAAIFSQFGAAVADTIGAGALLNGETNGRLTQRQTYPILIGVAIVLVWAFDIFSVLTLASRAFAAFYCLQAILALLIARRQRAVLRRPGQVARRLVFAGLAASLFLVVIFAIPAEGGGETGDIHVAHETVAQEDFAGETLVIDDGHGP